LIQFEIKPRALASNQERSTNHSTSRHQSTIQDQASKPLQIVKFLGDRIRRVYCTLSL